MMVEDGKIIKATETEIYSYWLKHWSDLMSFDEYIRKIEAKGVKVIHDNK